MDIWRRGITRRKDVPIPYYTRFVYKLQGLFLQEFKYGHSLFSIKFVFFGQNLRLMIACFLFLLYNGFSDFLYTTE